MPADWPPPEAWCSTPHCHGVISPESLDLDPRGRGECGRCGNFFEWRGLAWVHVDQPTDKPHAG